MKCNDINCKVELKLRWSKHCILSVAGADNANGNNDDNDIIFTIKDKIVPIVLYEQETIQNNQNF